MLRQLQSHNKFGLSEIFHFVNCLKCRKSDIKVKKEGRQSKSTICTKHQIFTTNKRCGPNLQENLNGSKNNDTAKHSQLAIKLHKHKLLKFAIFISLRHFLFFSVNSLAFNQTQSPIIFRVHCSEGAEQFTVIIISARFSHVRSILNS